ncbi:MAG: hypothetical protein JWN44_970 [Myxococcales bacterium]|nr:hypothetical protein [Myxococcales bacterium]
MNVRHAIAALIAVFCGCANEPPAATPPAAPTSKITVVTSAMTYDGLFDAQMVGAANCPAAEGVGPRAGGSDAAVTALFSVWPESGQLYDLSEPGASDLLVVAADVGGGAYCSNRGRASGFVDVRRFQQVGDRYIVDVVIENVVSGDALINAHLYH